MTRYSCPKPEPLRMGVNLHTSEIFDDYLFSS